MKQSSRLSSILLSIAAALLPGACSPSGSGTEVTIPPAGADAVPYESLHDPVEEAGQFYMPPFSRMPALYWTCVDALSEGLPYQLLCESLAGIVNGAFQEGRADFGLWIDVDSDSYRNCRKPLGEEIGRQTAYELLTKEYGPFAETPVQVKDLVEGYVLADLDGNPESTVAASVAAHVFQSVIADVRLQDFFEEAGYRMTYDAREKTTEDAWNEFRDRCRNEALVVMPVGTAELRDFSISRRLFVFNLNKERGTTSGGMNSALFDKVLAWLEPNSPVLGWESGEFGEDEFVGKVSQYGHLMLAADWSYNHPLTAAGARERQPEALAPVINPREIDYAAQKNYLSFFLTDGDNYQWIMGDGFVQDYYALPESTPPARMGYGLAAQALAELAPDRYETLLRLPSAQNTLMETFGGGYFYADTYAAKTVRRAESLSVLARRTAAHMRQHRLKVLQLTAFHALSDDTIEACQAFVDANDQLEGIVIIQYAPYTGGKGAIRWCTNRAGYDIPVVTVKYALWKGMSPSENGGNPKEVAERMKAEEPAAGSFAFCCVHAWSSFAGLRSADAARSCMAYLPGRFEAVSVQELIWRIRMQERPEQTRKYLSTIK